MAQEVLEVKEEKLKSNLRHKSFLIITKYIPHFIALCYAINTVLQFCGIDYPQIGCFVHISVLSWIYFYLASIVFRYCYVHKLPLYYILINEGLTELDYYIGIPISTQNLLIVHLLLMILLIFGYSFYYIRFILKKRNE